MLRALLLDVGNTLVYESPSRAAIYAAEARRLGAAVTEEAMRECMERAHRDLPRVVDGHYRYTDGWFRRFVEHVFHDQLGLPASELPGAMERLFARFEDAATFRVFPGAVELLEWARGAGLVVGVVSNWSARLPRLLEAVDLARRLDFVVCSALERAEKPERRIFEIALGHAGVEPAEAAHAGDHPVRDGAAAELGLHAVLVDHFGALAHSPLPVVGDLPSLRAWLEERVA